DGMAKAVAPEVAYVGFAIPSPDFATELMRDRQLSFITDIKVWTEGLETAAWNDGSVGVATAEVEYWQDEMDANVDVTQIDNLEEDSFNTLQTWLDQLYTVSVNNNGTAYLDGPTLQNYNNSLDNMEGIVRQATMQREAVEVRRPAVAHRDIVELVEPRLQRVKRVL
ncbi:MAG: hypothetical protein AAFQ86_19040, partial [Bacteroidota bacterium]